MIQREVISPDGRQALYAKNGYSAAIKSDDLLFVSGQVGSLPDGTAEPDFARQVELAFDNLQAILKAAGCTVNDIVDITTFHTDPKLQMDVVMAAKQKVFPAIPYPNWTAVGVTWLSGFDFEIKVIARIPVKN